MKQVKLAGFIIVVFLLIVGFLTTINTFNRKPEFNMSKTTVIKELKELNRLETAQFTIEKVIDSGTQNSSIREILFGDRILLIAHGAVIAGFDLSQMKESDITITKESLTLTLPEPQILITSLNNAETRVYDRRKGLLTQGDKDLESKARVAAQEAIQDAACSGGILNEASVNARKQLTALFKTLGYSSVTITIPQGSC